MKKSERFFQRIGHRIEEAMTKWIIRIACWLAAIIVIPRICQIEDWSVQGVLIGLVISGLWLGGALTEQD
jgi:hypothetical protein